ncbi:MAG: hypothetical protein R3F59_19415 [Myxococcota bacterium]
MISTLLPTLLFLAAPARASGCDPSALDQALDAVDRAFVASDDKAMGDAVKLVRKAVRCYDAPVPPGTCARIHRARALAAWLDGEEIDAVAWLRAMLHADPRTELAPDVVDPRHRLRTLLLWAEEEPNSWTEGAGHHWLLVDGVRTGAVPAGQPYVVQPLRDDGTAQHAKLVDRWKSRAAAHPRGPASGASMSGERG